jgi:hypothetical protein
VFELDAGEAFVVVVIIVMWCYYWVVGGLVALSL